MLSSLVGKKGPKEDSDWLICVMWPAFIQILCLGGRFMLTGQLRSQEAQPNGQKGQTFGGMIDFLIFLNFEINIDLQEIAKIAPPQPHPASPNGGILHRYSIYYQN